MYNVNKINPMREQFTPAPEQAKRQKEAKARAAIERYCDALEAAGRRVIAVLGPAMVLGGPAFAGEPVRLSPNQETRCEIAYLNQNGEQVGSGSITLPKIEDLSAQDTKTSSVELQTTGNTTSERIIGLLTEKPEEQPQKTPKNEEETPDRSIKSMVKNVQDHSYNKNVSGMGKAIGWTFAIDTSQSPSLAGYDVHLTTAVTIGSYNAKNLLAGEMPKNTGAFVKLEIKPKK